MKNIKYLTLVIATSVSMFSCGGGESTPIVDPLDKTSGYVFEVCQLRGTAFRCWTEGAVLKPQERTQVKIHGAKEFEHEVIIGRIIAIINGQRVEQQYDYFSVDKGTKDFMEFMQFGDYGDYVLTFEYSQTNELIASMEVTVAPNIDDVAPPAPE